MLKTKYFKRSINKCDLIWINFNKFLLFIIVCLFTNLTKILSIEEELDLPTTAHIVDAFMVDLYANKPIPNISKALWEKLTFIYNSFNLICILFIC